MKTILVLRHAKSSWDDPDCADHDRPLNKRGEKDAPWMGKLLKKAKLLPDLIICSTAKRARKTVEAVADKAGYKGEIQYTGDFYMADPEDYLKALQNVSDECDCVMVVGHNPGMQELVSELSGRDETFPTAALAQLRLPIQHWRELDDQTRGELVNLWRPKELK